MNIGTIWSMTAGLMFIIGFVIMLQKYSVPFLNGSFDLGVVLFFGSIVMLLLGFLLLGQKTE